MPRPAKNPPRTDASAGRAFVSYSHKDKKYLDMLKVHLGPLVREKKLDLWDDSKIDPGTEWRKEIATAVKRASIAILLVSPDFLNSDFIANNELPPLLRAAKSRGVTILWLLVRPALVQTVPKLTRYQAVHDAGKALSEMKKPERERLLVSLAKRLMTAGTAQVPKEKSPRRNAELKGSVEDEDPFPFLDVEFPVILWCLPRGFILVEGLMRPVHDSSWAVTAEYYSYPAVWQHGTHYHESYEDHWLEDNFDSQLRKLHIPRGDWFYARNVLNYMHNVRHGRVVIGKTGVTLGSAPDREVAALVLKGPLKAPRCPRQYRGLTTAGPLRDVQEELRLLTNPSRTVLYEDAQITARELRREARSTAAELLNADHPARQHIDEAWQRVDTADNARAYWSALKEFEGVIGEAAEAVRKIVDAKK